jgi:eukaryotic-like serine/threonine-protein kinase
MSGHALSDRLKSALSDRYRIDRELGAGGMATVFLAQDLKHDRQVAIKVLREDVSASLGTERFLREIKVAAALQHPHILPLYDSGDAAGLLYYVMPFVDGQSLRDKLVRQGEFPVGDAVRILRDIADALSEAHRHGVVHRDLKPENVMLRGRHALVTDFGVAKALSEATGRQSLTTLGVALGTPTYMAPEQAVADPHVDHRADLYAFGVVAYELLTGMPPFAAASPQQVLAAHVTAAPVPVSSHRTLSVALSTLVMRCLEKKPADRWQSAEELIAQLEAILTPSGGMTPTATAPAQAIPVGVAATPSPWRRTALALGGVLGLVGAVAIGWSLLAGDTINAPASTGIEQIAVLPFENIGGDTANAYFADGMTDELANVLAKVPQLRVASRTSSYAFRNAQARDISAIREALKVGALLEGTVSRVGNQLRVSARLTKTSDGVEVWSDAFVRPATDIFAVQNELARSIVGALTPALGGGVAASHTDTSRGTADPVAYDLYLRARHLWYQRGIIALQQSVALFEQALARDSGFARAWAGLGLAKISLADFEARSTPTLPAEIESAAARAIAIDSALAEPHLALGFLRLRTWRVAEAEREFLRALELEPRSATAHQWYGIFLHNYQRPEEGIRETQIAVDLDPLSAQIMSNHAAALASAGRMDEARETRARAIALDPRNFNVRLNGATSLIAAGRARELLSDLDEAVKLGAPLQRTIALRVDAHIALGDSLAARAAVREVVARLGNEAPSSFFLAYAYVALGDRETALATLDRASQSFQWSMGSRESYMTSPRWAPVRADPRFLRAVERLRER